MSSSTTRSVEVAVGVPVWQGENYLAETLKSLLAQTASSFEIIVSDNDSRDGTVAIVEDAANADERVRLIRQPENIGAVANYNAVFSASTAEFFWWNAHDDVVSPRYAQAGVDALRSAPDAVVAVATSRIIGPDGEQIGELVTPPGLFSDHPHERLRAAVLGSPAGVVFGVFRSSAVRRSRGHRAYTGSDRTFVVEMMLQGPATRMEGDSWFALREHDGRSVRSTQKTWFSHPREGWFAPNRAGKIVFPNWRRTADYWTAVARSPLRLPDRFRCWGTLFGLFFRDRGRLTKQLLADLVKAGFTFGAKLVRRAS